jgi:Leucine-rich repeat (LRR) protein
MKLKIVIVFLFILLFYSLSFAAISSTERSALIAIYNSTNGDSWDNNDGWKEPPLYSDGFAMPGTENNWNGVGVSSSGDEVVIHVHLNDNQLTGNIPVEIGSLGNLTQLYLHRNQLTGSIPVAIGNMESLTALCLDTNQLTGSIPAEIGNLDNLGQLDLHANQLTGSIPAEIGNLKTIYYLLLEENQLTGSIPAEIGNLTTLDYLSIHTNQLTDSIPPEIGNLTGLYVLLMHGNLLTGSIPEEITSLLNIMNGNLKLCANSLHSDNPEVIDFLNLKTGLDWQECQLKANTFPTFIPLLLLDQ